GVQRPSCPPPIPLRRQRQHPLQVTADRTAAQRLIHCDRLAEGLDRRNNALQIDVELRGDAAHAYFRLPLQKLRHLRGVGLRKNGPCRQDRSARRSSRRRTWCSRCSGKHGFLKKTSTPASSTWRSVAMCE